MNNLEVSTYDSDSRDDSNFYSAKVFVQSSENANNENSDIDSGNWNQPTGDVSVLSGKQLLGSYYSISSRNKRRWRGTVWLLLYKSPPKPLKIYIIKLQKKKIKWCFKRGFFRGVKFEHFKRYIFEFEDKIKEPVINITFSKIKHRTLI